MYGKKMKRIKLFESFDLEMTEQEIRGALVELVDVGYDVMVAKLDPKLFNGYICNITKNNSYFGIVTVSEPILELISYLEEKFGESFFYLLKYIDTDTECEMIIDNLEKYIKDYPLEDTYEVIIILRLK